MPRPYKETLAIEQAREALGKRIKDAREAAGLTQIELGQLCGWGSEAQSRVSNYELGKREPTLLEIAKMAEKLGVDRAALAFDVHHLPTEEARILRAYRIATEKEKSFFISTCTLIEEFRAQQKRRNKSLYNPGLPRYTM